jgi:hypothetical protein
MVVAVQSERSNLWNVYKQEVSKTKSAKLILNFTSASISCSSLVHKDTPSLLVNFGKNIKNANSFLGLLELPIKIEKFFKSLITFNSKKPTKCALDISTNFCAVVSGGCNAVKFVDTLNPLHNKSFVNRTKIIGAHAGLILAFKALVDSILKLKNQIFSYKSIQNDASSNVISAARYDVLKEKNKCEFASNILSIAAKTTVLALAIIALVTLVVPISVVLVTFLSFSSAFLNLTSFFFDRVFIPDEIK